MKKIFICALLIFLFSCQKETSQTFDIQSGHWGHLQDLDSTTSSKLYLSHVKSNDIYSICVPNYFLKKYSGIENEIIAAINIWGHYIGRKIKVELLKTDLEIPRSEQSEEEIIRQYYSKCPNQTDLVLGESFFSDQAVGKTMPSYTFVTRNGKRDIFTFQRALFLKFSSLEEDSDSPYNWVTLSQKMNRTFTSKELLDLMIQRDTKIFLENKNELLTLKTITHEFGHVWGLCDQYALAGGKTNCDPNYATINERNHIILDDESIMSKSKWVNKIYLTNDDIEGIRKLAQRQSFQHDWPKSNDFEKTQVNSEITSKEIEFAVLKNATFENDQYNLNMALYTNGQELSIGIEFYLQSQNKWIKYGTSITERKIQTNDYTLQVQSNRNEVFKKVRLKILSKSQEIQLENDINQIGQENTNEAEN